MIRKYPVRSSTCKRSSGKGLIFSKENVTRFAVFVEETERSEDYNICLSLEPIHSPLHFIFQ